MFTRTFSLRILSLTKIILVCFFVACVFPLFANADDTLSVTPESETTQIADTSLIPEITSTQSTENNSTNSVSIETPVEPVVEDGPSTTLSDEANVLTTHEEVSYVDLSTSTPTTTVQITSDVSDEDVENVDAATSSSGSVSALSTLPTIIETYDGTGKTVVVSATPEQELITPMINVPVHTQIPEIFRMHYS